MAKTKSAKTSSDFSYLFWIFGGLVYLGVLGACLLYPTDFDSFWHLRHGLNIIELNLWPFQDQLSFTFAGKDVSYFSPLFAIFLAVSEKIFGSAEVAFSFYRVLCFTLLFLLLAVQFKKDKPNWLVAIFAVSLLSVFAGNTIGARAELIAYVFNAGLVAYLIRRKTLTNREALAVAALLLVWTNWHLSAAIGYVTVGAFYAQWLWENARKQKKFGNALSWGVFTFLVGFLTPHYLHPVVSAFGSFEDFSAIIQENRVFSYWESNSASHTVVFVAVFLIGLSAYLRQIFPVIVLSVMTYETLMQEKMFLHLAIVCVVLLLYYSPKIVDLVRLPRIGKYIPVLAIGLLAFNSFDLVRNYAKLWPRLKAGYVKNNYDNNLIPYELSDYIRQNAIKGNVLNEFAAGGYLSYEHWPDLKVFIDGRVNILYDRAFSTNYFVGSKTPGKFKELVTDYPIDYVIADMTTPYRLTEWAIRVGGYSLKYVGKNHVILGKGMGEFPWSSQLYVYPHCFVQADPTALAAESQKAKDKLPAKSQLLGYLDFATRYLTAADKTAFLKDFHSYLDPTQRWANRAAGAMAFKNNLPDLGVDFYLAHSFGLRRREISELINYDCQKYNCENAVDLFSHYKASKIPQHELQQIQLQIDRIAEKYPDAKNYLVSLAQDNSVDYSGLDTETCPTIR